LTRSFSLCLQNAAELGQHGGTLVYSKGAPILTNRNNENISQQARAKRAPILKKLHMHLLQISAAVITGIK
jgi:hypothetical protein